MTRAPRWMQKCGLEWSYRLLREPRRLWRRYLILAPIFVCLVLLDLMQGRVVVGERQMLSQR